jgi:hypothetical protein
MEVEYYLTPEDMTAFDKHFGNTKETPRRKIPLGMLLMAAVIVCLSILGITLVQSGNIRFWEFLGPYNSGFAMAFVLTCFFWQRERDRVNPRRDSFEDKHGRWQYEWLRLTIAREGLVLDTAYSKLIQEWPAVWKVEATADHVFLFTASESAHVVPRRAFHSEKQFEEFVALCQRCRQYPASSGIMAKPPVVGPDRSPAILRSEKH